MWLAKYRRNVLPGEVLQPTKDLLAECCERHDLTRLAWETDQDQGPLFVSASPRFSPAAMAHGLNGASSHYLRERFPHLTWVCGKDRRWTQA